MTRRSRLLSPLPLLLGLLTACSGSPLEPGARARVATVVVAPGNLVLEVGASAGLTASLLDADGSSLPSPVVVWTSTDTTVASVSPSGLVSARGIGAAAIRASSDGKSGGVTVTVRERTAEDQRPVAWIQITPAGGTLPQAIGTAQQLGVVARASDGSVIAAGTVTWTSSVPSVASVSASGLLRAHAAGTAWVKAELAGRRDSVLVSVPTLIARIETDPAELSLGVGDLASIGATALDALGNPLARAFVWSSGNGAVATVDAAGRVQARGAGSTLITVTSEGKSATTRVTVSGRQWHLTDAAGAPLPAVLYSASVDVGGVSREARFQVTEGTLRVVNGRYELRLEGWLLVEGRAPERTTHVSAGAVAYDMFTGAPLFFAGDEWQNQQPRFRSRLRENDGLELDWSRQPGAATVAIGFAP